jgi:fumarylacetoacetate (FAA) hydrolase family protein
MDQLPADWRDAALLGRLLTPRGPSPILVLNGRVLDISAVWPTTADFISAGAPLDVRSGAQDLGPFDDLQLEPAWRAPDAAVRLLSPLDLQCVKAAGVTFAVSTLERVIEERARGDAARAEALRSALGERIGAEVGAVRPGTPQAAALKAALIGEGLWSQYLEVAIGPDAEVFTKAPCLSTVGWGDFVGVRSDSRWNNPEPEIVLVCGRDGQVRGAALGNDVNLRDFEGRSALLLGKAKDNNASCAVGPFIRLFDGGFSLDDVRKASVHLEVVGEDNFRLEGTSSMDRISRDPLEIVDQTIGKHHQYPDGFGLFLGTMFAPIEDRDVHGQGFTHKPGDLVRVSNPRLGVLENKVTTCDQAPAWTFGIADLMRNLAGRGLLGAAEAAHA